MYGVILGKDHPTLPLSELKSVLEISGAAIVSEHDGFVLVDKRFEWKRLAMSRLVFRVQYSGKNPNSAGEYVDPKGTFAVRISHNKRLEGIIGKTISRKVKVDLTDPDEVFFGINKDQFYFGKVVWERPSFEDRKVQNRPYFHPTSIHPKYARVLVNLSGVKRGEKLLDPFCGTGGILIEASLIKAKVFGSDVDSDMVRGSKDNLEFYKLEGVVKHGDARKLTGKYDAIATDPPYGRSSFVTGKKLQKLYDESIRSMEKVLKSGKKLVIVVPDTVKLKVPTKLKILEKHYQRVHKSLSRYFYVLEKSKERHD